MHECLVGLELVADIALREETAEQRGAPEEAKLEGQQAEDREPVRPRQRWRGAPQLVRLARR